MQICMNKTVIHMLKYLFECMHFAFSEESPAVWCIRLFEKIYDLLNYSIDVFYNLFEPKKVHNVCHLEGAERRSTKFNE
jgi:hypothetical protein